MDPSASRPRRVAVLLGLVALLATAGCGSTGTADAGAGAPGKPPPVADQRQVRVSDLTPADLEEFRQAWTLFVTKDLSWPGARDQWLAKGGAAPYLLAENLFRYFWSASKANMRAEIARISQEAGRVGEPATAYFVKALVTDKWPLGKPVTAKVFNPDSPKQPIMRTFTHYDIDDVTRQHAAYVLAGIGAPAVPLLSSSRVMNAKVPTARRYGAYALGAIATDEAVAALGRMYDGRHDWQDRGAVVKGMGFALRKGNANARALLQKALNDPDEFVRRKAQEGLEGKTRIEF